MAEQTPSEDALDQLAKATKDVTHKFNVLNAQGLGIPDEALINTRVEVLVEHLLTPDQRTAFETAFMVRVSEMLDETLAEVHRQKNSFTQPSKRLIVPN